MQQWVVRLAALTLAVALVAGVAVAAELTGKVQKVDKTQNMFVLEDGTELWVTDGTSLDKLSEGTKVKAAYEEKDGKKVITRIEVVP